MNYFSSNKNETPTVPNSAPPAANPASRNILPTWRDDVGDDFKVGCKSMSYENRMYSFLACLAIGAACSVFSIMFLILVKVVPFAIMYSIGSIMGLASTMFLVGPLRQMKLMFHKNRWVATVLYLVLIVATLAIGFSNLKKAGKVLIVIIFVVLQFLAACWYALSYIPYGRKVVNKAFGGACDFLLI